MSRNDAGQVLIPFDPEVVGDQPLVFLSPWWNGTTVAAKSVPTMGGFDNVNDTPVIKVNDKNDAENYYLNVLFVRPDAQEVHGLTAAVQSENKPNAGEIDFPKLLGHTGFGVDTIDLLSPYWQYQILPTGYAEVVRDPNFPSENTQSSEVIAASGNHSAPYYVNHLSCIADSIPHAIQSGRAVKTASDTTRVEFPDAWDHPPIVFATPVFKEVTAGVQGVETVSNVTGSYFDVVSPSTPKSDGFNWVAFSSNPHLHKDHVDAGFQHIVEQFASQVPTLNHFESDLKKAVLSGEPIDEQLHHLAPRDPLPPVDTDPVDGAELFFDAANLSLDTFVFVLRIFNLKAPVVALEDDNVRQAARNAIANSFFQNKADSVAFFNSEQKLMQKVYRDTDVTSRIKHCAEFLLNILAHMVKSGLMKQILKVLFQKLEWFDWAIMAIKLASQFAIWLAGSVASAGIALAAFFLAWVARIAQILSDGKTVIQDIVKTIKDVSTVMSQQTQLE